MVGCGRPEQDPNKNHPSRLPRPQSVRGHSHDHGYRSYGRRIGERNFTRQIRSRRGRRTQSSGLSLHMPVSRLP